MKLCMSKYIVKLEETPVFARDSPVLGITPFPVQWHPLFQDKNFFTKKNPSYMLSVQCRSCKLGLINPNHKAARCEIKENIS